MSPESAALLATLTAGLAWLSWARSQLPYNEQGRYFDAANAVVLDEQAVGVYAALTLLCAAATFATAWPTPPPKLMDSATVPHEGVCND